MLKIIKVLLILIIFISSPLYALQKNNGNGNGNGGGNGGGNGKNVSIEENYAMGVKHGESFMQYPRPEENYNAYIGLVIKNCAGLTNSSTGATVYAPGDVRLGVGLCAFTLGVKDGFYGTVSDITKCSKDNVENRGFYGNSDQVNQQGNQRCLTAFVSYNDNPNVPIHFCPRETVRVENAISNIIDVNYELPGGTYREGVMAFAKPNEEGQDCITSDYELECSGAFRCQKKGNGVPLKWTLVEESCQCVRKDRKQCLGAAPVGREYCKCGEWVSFQQYRSNTSCL